MKKLIFGFLIFLLLFFLIFYFLDLFFWRTIIIKPSTEKISLPEKSETLPTKIKETLYLEDFKKTKEDLILLRVNFLEVNLSEMKLRIYQEGDLKKEVSILAKGDLQDWGGSAAGLYQVISKNKLSYSIITEVYMPYAIHYYGKYYLHGEPYYPGGEKLISEVSGGCIRLPDKDAKTVYELTEKEMPVLVIDKENDSYEYPTKEISEFPQILAKSYLVADLDSGLVFAEKNSQEKLPAASLTKLMTATVVAENVDLRKSILVRPEMLSAYGKTQGLESGKNFRVVELFYPLLIESSNDAAEILGYFLGREKTVRLMNEKANSILMENTKFVDLHGFDSQNISTTQDLFYLARYIFNNRPLLFKITKGEKVRFFDEVNFKNLENKNLFFEDPNFLGGKTGYIEASKYNGIFIFRFPLGNDSERRIVIILLGSEKLKEGPESLENDVQKIFNWLKENYFGENL